MNMKKTSAGFVYLKIYRNHRDELVAKFDSNGGLRYSSVGGESYPPKFDSNGRLSYSSVGGENYRNGEDMPFMAIAIDAVEDAEVMPTRMLLDILESRMSLEEIQRMFLRQLSNQDILEIALERIRS
jgi:hypothetical protein